MPIKEFRAQYPEYNDIPDDTLADRMYERHRADYSDLTKEQFRAKFLGHASEGAKGPTTPSSVFKMPKQMNIAPAFAAAPALQLGVGAAQTMAEEGGLPFLAKLPQRAAREAWDTVRGLGPLIAGGLHAASLPPRIAGEAALNALTGRKDNVALEEAQQAGRAIGRAAPQMLQDTLGHFAEEQANPGGEFLKHPVATTLDALAGADLPALGLRGLAGAASRIGAEGFAKGAMRAGEAISPEAVAGRTLAGLESEYPMIQAAMQRRRDIGLTRRALAEPTKEGAVQSEKMSGEIMAASKGLRPAEQEAMTPIAMGTASMAKQPFRPPTLIEKLLGKGSQPADKAGMERGLDWYRNRVGANTAEAVAAGELTPRTAELRRFQPLRLATGDEGQIRFEAAPRREYNVAGLEKKAQAAEKLAAGARKKGIIAAVKESEAARLGGALKQSNVETAALIAAEKKAARYAGRSEQAQKGLSPLEAMPQGTERARLARQATDVTKAELGGESAGLEAAASKAAIPGRPVTLARKLGKTEAQLSEAQRWQRVAQTAEARKTRLLAEADAKRGRIPALERLERQTEAAKFLDPNANPTYVPMLPKRGEILKEMFLKHFPKPIRPQTPGFLKQSAGARFAEGNFEPNLFKIAARHEQARIAYATRVKQLQGIVSQPFARPVKSLKDVDWTKESLIAPEAFIKNTGAGLSSSGKLIQEAMASANPQAHLAQAAAETVVKKAPPGAPAGALYAVPKHVAKELAGQLGSEGAKSPIMQAVFDTPNTYLRWTALTLRPGFYVNNLVGNAALAGLSGMDLKGFKGAISKEGRASMPASIRGAGFGAVESPHASITLGKLGEIGKLPNVLNEGIDNIFRHASFRSEVEKQAMRKSIRDTGTRLAKNMADAEKAALLGPEGVSKAMQHTNQFLNDYTVQAPFQKRVLSKVLPFQSFLVHMGKLAVRLPFTDPNRANILAKFAQLGNEYQREQFRESGVPPENVASYRLGQLPIRKTDTGMVTMGTGGINPASGLGAANVDMQEDPGVASILNALAEQSGPVPQQVLTLLRGTNAIGLPYKKPGVKPESYGSRNFVDAEGNPVAPPTPSLVDMLRQNTPLAKILEAAAQPNETYDLTGSPFPWDPNYLPDRKIGGKVVPRRYGLRELLLQYAGMPMRDFQRSEVVAHGKAANQ